MKAAVLAAVGTLAIEERPDPELGAADEVALGVEACGICGTDLHILSDPPSHPANVGVVLGHEFVGVVTDVGSDVRSLRVDERVAVAPNLWCGECASCRRGFRNQCENGTTYGIFIDGGLAPQVIVKSRACHPLSHDLPAHVAALAEPLSTVVHGVRQAAVFPGEIAVVLGAGPIGAMFCALLAAAGASVVAVEPTAERAELALRLGADRVVEPGGLGAVRGDLVVDAVGSQLGAALDAVAPGGRVLLFGMNQHARAEVAQSRITRDELTILGSYVGQDVFPDAIRLLEQGRADWDALVTHRVGVEELPSAVDELRSGRALKVEVEFA
ncbi:MAG TPA: alcohol dehydrogenase catalytic domain-containing protein [Gaiellaceae bacterium]|nr:alcohol dehydrogenase catalytic domain-containing protein [Gaiellaceae bacterium]